MKGSNGYFQLIIKKDGTYIKLINSSGEGKPINYDEICNYLIDIKMYDFDKAALGKALVSLTDTLEVRLTPNKLRPQDEYMNIEITEDKMYAKVRFLPPSNEGNLLSREDIISNLVKSGVKYGVDEEVLSQFLKTRNYGTDLILAKATPAIQGKDAKITYYFNIDITMKPKTNEDGSVDFHQLDLISHCNKGDLLATLTPVEQGKPGIDVCGNILRPVKVNNQILRHGNNIHLSEDGLNMYSDVDGHVTLTEGRVFVSDTYDIPADVNASTGDIDYEGNVIIRGNVITGFSVRARGDIEVHGVVEGAYLEAGGQIILRRGMQGMNKGVLRAKGNIITKFIENAEVISGGYISTESIMHSKVSAKADITVSGKRGLVTGGEVRSGIAISLKTVGSHMGTNTLLEVGVDPIVSEEFRELEKRISTLQVEKDRLSQVIAMLRKKLQLGGNLSNDKMLQLKEITKQNILIEAQLNEDRKRYDDLRGEMEGNISGSIKVYDTAHPGTKIVIAGVIYYVRDTVQHCMFIRDRADIKLNPL